MSAAPAAGAPAAAASLVPLGNFLFRHRNYLFPIFLLAIVFLGRPLYPFGSAGWDLALDGLGIAVAVAGQMIRALVIALAYVRLGGKSGKVYADGLVQEGIFAHSRNPLYVGNMSILVGLFLVLNSALGYAVGVPAFFLAYRSLVAAEEKFLLGKFGEPYRDYCRRVNRFLPSLSGLGGTLRSQPLDWKRSLRKDYGSIYAWLSLLVLLLFWDRTAVADADWVRATGRPYLLAWGVVTLGYVVVRTLKKTRRLN